MAESACRPKAPWVGAVLVCLMVVAGCSAGARRRAADARDQAGSASTRGEAGTHGEDAESLFLVGGVPYIITKSAFPAVYRATSLDPRRTSALRRVGSLASGMTEPVIFPTGADLEADHGRLSVATYATLAIYQASDPSLRGEALVADLIGHPARWTVELGCLICPVSQLSLVEGVAFTGRDQDLTLLSERHDVWHIPTAAYER